MSKKYYEPQYGSPEYDMESHLEARKGERKALQRLKNDRTRARVVSQARKVQDKVSINDYGFRQMTKGTAEIEARDNRIFRELDKANTKSILSKKKPNVTYRTQGKQKLLSGGKAGGMSYIFKEMKRRLMKGTPGTSSKTY